MATYYPQSESEERMLHEMEMQRTHDRCPSCHGSGWVPKTDSAGLLHDRIAPASGRLLKSRPINKPELM